MAPLARSSSRPRGRQQRVPRQRTRLRIAVFADAARQPRWLVDALAAVAQADFADIVLVAIADDAPPPPALPLSWRAYRHADRWLFAAGNDPSTPAEIATIAPQARQIRYGRPPAGHLPAWRGVVGSLPPLDVAFVVGALDDAEFEDIARFGVWRYCFGAANAGNEALAGWQEVTADQPVTQAGLRVRLWPGVSRLLYQSSSRTDPLSVARNRDKLLRKASQFALRELRQLHRQGMARLRAPGPALPTPRDAMPRPGVFDALGGLARIGGRILRHGWQKLSCIDQWSIAFRFGPPGRDNDLATYARLLPPPDRHWVAPMPCVHNGHHYIFFEEVPLATGKGHIAVVEVHADGSHSSPRIVLEEDYHLSYPFLIEDGGHLYLAAGGDRNRRIELYRCLRFPDLWHRDRVLLDGVACADATFHRDTERWWMFVNIGVDGADLDDELHLFHADALHGKWLPHPDNPIKSDVRGARPAGQLFMRGGALYRPAQICAPRHGAGIAIARIDEMTPHAYREEIVDRLLPLPEQGILGLHTLNRSGRLGVIDCFARRHRF